GGHFVSDIVWSAFIALGLAHLIHGRVLRAAGKAPSAWRAYALPLAAGIGGLCILLALFVMPHGAQVHDEIAVAALSPQPKIFALSAAVANVEITLVDAGVAVSIDGELHGFGLPASRLGSGSHYEPSPVPTLRYAVEQQGWFTDLDANLSVRLPAAGLERIVVRLGRGSVKVTDATREH